jgi:hypothetical protein
MAIKFVDCYTPEIKHKSYNKTDPNSTQGLQQNRVKITTVRDCRRINIENEELEKETEDNEVQDSAFEDSAVEDSEVEDSEVEDSEVEDSEVEDNEFEEKKEEQTMAVLMENFRKYIKNADQES